MKDDISRVQCGMTIRGRGLRTGQKTSQKRNTTITPEMRAAQWKPGQSGNPSGRPHKTPFTTALLRIVEKKLANDREGRAYLDAIAQQLVTRASKGDLASIRELADRIEGKPQRAGNSRRRGWRGHPVCERQPGGE